MNYLLRNNQGIKIGYNNECKFINVGIVNYINKLCINNLSTYKGRIDASKKVLNTTSKLPIYIDDTIVLFPNISIRRYDCILINYMEILSITKVFNSKCRITFNDLSVLFVDTSHQVIVNQMRKTQLLLDGTLKKKVFTLLTY